MLRYLSQSHATTYRNSHLGKFYKKVFLKISQSSLEKITGKVSFTFSFTKKEAPAKVFSSEFCEIFRNTSSVCFWTHIHVNLYSQNHWWYSWVPNRRRFGRNGEGWNKQGEGRGGGKFSKLICFELLSPFKNKILAYFFNQMHSFTY